VEGITHEVFSIISNDEGLYNLFREYAVDAIEEAKKAADFEEGLFEDDELPAEVVDAAVDSVRVKIEEFLDERPQLDDLWGAIFEWAVNEIDAGELAKAFVEMESE